VNAQYRHFHTPAATAAATPAASWAASRYRTADLEARVAAADPHELVSMLLTGLRDALGKAERALTSAARTPAAGRALAIIEALDTSLDFSAGGSVARALNRVYAQVRMLVVAGNLEIRPELFAAAAAQIAAVHASWGAIRPSSRA